MTSPFQFEEPKTRELTEKEKKLCHEVVAEWLLKSTLSYRVCRSGFSGLIAGCVAAIIIGSFVAWLGRANVQPDAIRILGQQVPPYLEVQPTTTHGLKLSREPKVTAPFEITVENRFSFSVAASGKRSLEMKADAIIGDGVRSGLVIDDSLRENALYSEILSPGADERARDAAKKLYRILKALEDRDGLLNLEELDETTIGSLKAKELIRTATKPINPKAVTLTLEVPLTCYHYTIGFLIILIACGLCLACCILGIILVWRSRGSGDEIVLTQGALVIRTTATGQRTQVSFPWESVKVTENECSSSPNTMTIASGDRTFQFSANEIAGYDRLRAALISRVGITIWITTYTTTYS